MTQPHETTDLNEELPHEPPTGNRWGALQHRNFRWLVLGATINRLGASLSEVALAFAVLDLGGSATDLGLVVGAHALTMVLTTLFGGVLGDRVSRKVMMEGSNVASAAVMGAIAWSVLSGWASVPLLAGLSMVAGVAQALAGPSSSAITPLTVDALDLPSANAVRRLGANIAVVGGFSVAGMLVAAFGPGTAIALDAASYLIAALCYSLLRIPHTKPTHEPSMIRDLGEGFSEVMRHTWLWLLIAQALIYHLFFGGVQGVLGPLIVGEEFGRAAWGWSLSALMAGFVVGGLVSLRWRPRRALFAGTTCLALTACFPFAIALSPTVLGVLIGAFLHGWGLEIFSVWWETSIQQQVDPEKLARVYSFDTVGSFVARPIGLALTGPIAEAVGFTRWLVIVGVTMAGSTLLALLSRDVRTLVRREE